MPGGFPKHKDTKTGETRRDVGNNARFNVGGSGKGPATYKKMPVGMADVPDNARFKTKKSGGKGPPKYTSSNIGNPVNPSDSPIHNP